MTKMTWTNFCCIMKNLYKIGMLAAAAFAFASCDKEVDTNGEIAGTHVVTVTASKDFDTRTAIEEGSDQATYKWIDGDEAYFHIYENGKEATSVTMSLDAQGLATFTATFTNSTASSYEYTAKYFKEQSGSGNPLIIANQKPTLISYDPSADLLVAQSQTMTAPATQLQFALRRVATINKMTLKGMHPGEKVNSVELTSTDKNFSAYWIAEGVNDNGEVVPEKYSGAGKKLTFDYSELADATVGTDGTFAVYFVSAPVEEATFEVKVTTDQYVYERFLSSKLTLTLGKVKRFGISLEGYGEIISNGIVYTLVESAEDLQDGAWYIIVGSKDGVFQAAGPQTANNRTAVDVTVGSDGTITLDNTSSVHSFVLGETSDGYTFWDTDNTGDGSSCGYLYAAGEAASKQNYLRTSAELIPNAYWNISFSDGDISIVSVNNDKTPYMRYNSSNHLFACYNTASQLPVSLYVDESTCVPRPRIIVSPSEITNVSYRGVENADDITFTLKNVTGTVEVTCDGTTVTEAIDVDNTIVYSVARNDGEEARDGWIKIAVGEVSSTVTVSQAAAPSEIILGGLTDGKVYVGANVGDKVTFTVTANCIWVADWDYTMYVHGVDESFSFSPNRGNEDEIENNSTTVTVTADLANEGTEDRFLGEIDVYRDPELYSYAPEYMKVMVWQRAPQPEPEPAGTGAWNDPYNAAAALEEIDKLADGGYSSEVFVSGIISQIDEINTQYGNATYYITSGNATVEVFRGEYFNGVNFSAANQLVVGDDVTVYGKLQKYVKDGVVTPEIAQGNVLFELNGEIHMMTPTVSAETDNNAKTITVTWNAVAAATSYDVTCGTLSQTNLTATTTTFTMADYGKYDITVTAKASGLASVDGTTSATLTDPSSSTPDPETLTFSDKYNADTELNSVTLTGNNYSISFATGTGSNPPKYYKSGTAARIYGGNTVTITTSTGALSTIVFTCNTDTYASNLKAMSFSSGTATVSGSTVTWTGNASNLTITNSGTTQTRISSIVFNY